MKTTSSSSHIDRILLSLFVEKLLTLYPKFFFHPKQQRQQQLASFSFSPKKKLTKSFSSLFFFNCLYWCSVRMYTETKARKIQEVGRGMEDVQNKFFFQWKTFNAFHIVVCFPLFRSDSENENVQWKWEYIVENYFQLFYSHYKWWKFRYVFYSLSTSFLLCFLYELY